MQQKCKPSVVDLKRLFLKNFYISFISHDPKGDRKILIRGEGLMIIGYV
jgi:hypothetical protein